VRSDVGARAVLAVAGQRAIDDTRIDGLQRFVTEPQTVHDAGPELFHHDIHAPDQRLELRNGPRGLEIDRDAALAAVQ
jgi:hypothetical protein